MCKILIVDDEAEIREFARVALSEAGHEVCEASDGREALALLVADVHDPPCLALVDLRMPRMDGWDFIAAMKRDLRLKNIRVVVFSAAFRAGGSPPLLGAQAYWSKPPSSDQLERIYEHCGRHSRELPPEAASYVKGIRSAS